MLTEIRKELLKLKESVGDDVVPSFTLNRKYLVIEFNWPDGTNWSTHIPMVDDLPDLLEHIAQEARRSHVEQLRKEGKRS